MPNDEVPDVVPTLFGGGLHLRARLPRRTPRLVRPAAARVTLRITSKDRP